MSASTALIAATLSASTLLSTGAAAQRLMLQGGPVIIEVDPVANPINEDRSSRLRWIQVGSPSKVIVSASAVSQRFELFVSAVNAKRGMPVGEIALVGREPARDFITGIVERGAGACTLAYRAETRAEHGFGQEIHTVTYTITDQ